MDGPQHLRATGHPGHGLDEDVQVLLQPLDDLHGLVVVLAQGSQSLVGSGDNKKRREKGQTRIGKGRERREAQLEPVPTRGARRHKAKESGCCDSDSCSRSSLKRFATNMSARKCTRTI